MLAVIIPDTARSSMNDTASSPSRLLKITAVTARWLLGLLIAAWLLLALSVACPTRVDCAANRRLPWRAGSTGQQGHRRTGAHRIDHRPHRGALSQPSNCATWCCRMPRQREALRLVRVVASVSPRSLWRLNFEQLYIERPGARRAPRRLRKTPCGWIAHGHRYHRRDPRCRLVLRPARAGHREAAPCAGPTSSARPNPCC